MRNLFSSKIVHSASQLWTTAICQNQSRRASASMQFGKSSSSNLSERKSNQGPKISLFSISDCYCLFLCRNFKLLNYVSPHKNVLKRSKDVEQFFLKSNIKKCSFSHLPWPCPMDSGLAFQFCSPQHAARNARLLHGRWQSVITCVTLLDSALVPAIAPFFVILIRLFLFLFSSLGTLSVPPLTRDGSQDTCV